MKPRITRRSNFGPNLEWESLPAVGADRRRQEARARLRRTVAIVVCLWAVIAILASGLPT